MDGRYCSGRLCSYVWFAGSEWKFSAEFANGQQSPAAQSPAKPDAGTQQAPQGNGKVLFSRSDDDSTTAKPTSPAQPPAIDTSGLQATLEERDSLAFLDYDLDVRMIPRQESLAVRARDHGAQRW